MVSTLSTHRVVSLGNMTRAFLPFILFCHFVAVVIRFAIQTDRHIDIHPYTHITTTTLTAFLPLLLLLLLLLLLVFVLLFVLVIVSIN